MHLKICFYCTVSYKNINYKLILVLSYVYDNKYMNEL